jgi:hypothetical protein
VVVVVVAPQVVELPVLVVALEGCLTELQLLLFKTTQWLSAPGGALAVRRSTYPVATEQTALLLG